MQPGPEIRARLETAQLLVGLQKSLLDDVLGILRMPVIRCASRRQRGYAARRAPEKLRYPRRGPARRQRRPFAASNCLDGSWRAWVSWRGADGSSAIAGGDLADSGYRPKCRPAQELQRWPGASAPSGDGRARFHGEGRQCRLPASREANRSRSRRKDRTSACAASFKLHSSSQICGVECKIPSSAAAPKLQRRRGFKTQDTDESKSRSPVSSGVMR